MFLCRVDGSLRGEAMIDLWKSREAFLELDVVYCWTVAAGAGTRGLLVRHSSHTAVLEEVDVCRRSCHDSRHQSGEGAKYKLYHNSVGRVLLTWPGLILQATLKKQWEEGKYMESSWEERMHHTEAARDRSSIELGFLCNVLHASTLDLGIGFGHNRDHAFTDIASPFRQSPITITAVLLKGLHSVL